MVNLINLRAVKTESYLRHHQNDSESSMADSRVRMMNS